jgi:hypothetical protein
LYPVIAHVLMYKLGYLVDKLPHEQFWMTVQILLSGPALIILGLLLIRRYGQVKFNVVYGVTLILIGIFWLSMLVTETIGEAA